MNKRLKSYLIAKFSRLLDLYHAEKLNQVKSLPNILIDEGFQLGENCGISIQGVCAELKIARGVSTRKFCNFYVMNNARLIIHENVFFNNYCSVNCMDHIEIGHDTTFGEGVKMYDHNHKYKFDENNTLYTERADFNTGKILIGNDCWVGSNVTILSGVTIGDNVIIGANNLIFKSIPSNTIVKSKVEQIITTSNK